MQKYLYYWLLLVGLGHVVLGLVFVAVANTSFIDFYVSDLYSVFNVDASIEVDKLLRTILQLFGPTISSWGVLFCLAVRSYVKQGGNVIKYALILALLIWFAIDTFLSAMSGIYSHIVVNGVAAVSLLLPLVMLKPESPFVK